MSGTRRSPRAAPSSSAAILCVGTSDASSFPRRVCLGSWAERLLVRGSCGLRSHFLVVRSFLQERGLACGRFALVHRHRGCLGLAGDDVQGQRGDHEEEGFAGLLALQYHGGIGVAPFGNDHRVVQGNTLEVVRVRGDDTVHRYTEVSEPTMSSSVRPDVRSCVDAIDILNSWSSTKLNTTSPMESRSIWGAPAM